MKGSFAIATVISAVLCSGCTQTGLPASPSSLGSGALLTDTGRTGASPRAAESVPFKGSFQGTQALTPPDTINGSGTGTAAHLGRFTVEFPHTVNFAERTGVGTYTFTAANGDMVIATFRGRAEGGPIVSIVEIATITGGTGRFAGATGSFTVRRIFNSPAGTTEGSFDGTISPGGAN